MFRDTAPDNLTIVKSPGAANGLYVVGFTDANQVGNAGVVQYTGDGPHTVTFGAYPYVQIYAGGSGTSSMQLGGTSIEVVSTDLVNNKMIVDGGSWLGSDGSGDPDGDTEVQYQTNGGQGTVITTLPDDDAVVISLTGDRDNRWIADNISVEDFFVLWWFSGRYSSPHC